MPHPLLRRAARYAAFALVVSIATCTDNPAGPGHGGRAYLAIEPTLSSSVDLAAFGLVIDSLRLVIVRPTADTLVDTTLFFDPDSSQIDFASPLTLHAAAETLHVSVVMSARGIPVFSGAQDVEVTVGGPSVTPPATIPLTFTGLRDSTVVTFVPVPTGLAVAGGTGQTGPAGAPLGTPLRVRVTAADGLGVK